MDNKKSITKISTPSRERESAQETEPASRTVSGNLVDYYANATHLEWTLYDVRIRFGQLMFIGPPSLLQQTVDERAGISMAWASAKALRDSLSDVIARYERVNGEIKPLTLAPVE